MSVGFSGDRLSDGAGEVGTVKSTDGVTGFSG